MFGVSQVAGKGGGSPPPIPYIHGILIAISAGIPIAISTGIPIAISTGIPIAISTWIPVARSDIST